MSRKFVIDTSIARSAGGENATHPTPINCRDFLIAVREKGYFLVLTPDILEEWQKHRAKFTQTWLTSMFARKRVYRELIPEQTTLRQTVWLFGISGS